MKTNVSQSSLDAYFGEIEGQKELGQAERIALFVKNTGRCTRRQIAKALDMETSTVSARVNKLINSQATNVFQEHSQFVCPISNRPVKWIYWGGS